MFPTPQHARARPVKGIPYMFSAIEASYKETGERVALVATGPLSNVGEHVHMPMCAMHGRMCSMHCALCTMHAYDSTTLELSQRNGTGLG